MTRSKTQHRVRHKPLPKPKAQRVVFEKNVSNLNGTTPAVRKHKPKRAKEGATPAANSQTKMAAFTLLSPFESFADGIRPGCHIDTVGRATYKYATTLSLTLSSVQETAGTQHHVRFFVKPVAYEQLYQATAFSTANGGTPTAGAATSDPFYGNMGTSFHSQRVVYQAVRVRNITAVGSMGGESCIGRVVKEEADLLSYSNFRSALTRYVHSEADPGSVLQMTWEGTPDTAYVDGVSSRAKDYAFVDPGATCDASVTCMLYYSSAPAAHTVDVEIVTFYEAVPFATSQFVFCPTRSEIDIEWVEATRDLAYGEIPLYSIGRSVLRDDGVADVIISDAKAVWGGVKAGVRLFKNVGSLVSSAWSGLFGANHRAAMLRLVDLVPPEHFQAIVSELAEHKDHASARAAYLPVEPTTLTEEQIQGLLSLWQRSVVSEPPSPAASTAGRSLSLLGRTQPHR